MKSATAKEEQEDPKLKKMKTKKDDSQKGKEDNTPSAPKDTIDLTTPPEYKPIVKRKKEASTSHPSSQETRSKKNIQAPPKAGFRPSLKVLSTRIVDEGKIDQVGKHYESFSEIEKLEIHNMIIKHMIKFKKTVLELKTSIPDKVWDIL